MQRHIEALVNRAQHAAHRRLTSWFKWGIKAAWYHVGPLPQLLRRASQSAIILMYHKVQRRPVGLWGEPVLNVHKFEEHVSYLTREYEVVPLARIAKALKGEASLPDRAVALTFDDGYRNNLLLAAPVLKRHGAHATFFIATGLVGSDRWMWAYALEEMFLRFSPAEIGRACGDPIIAHLCAQHLSREVIWSACVEYLKSSPYRRLLQVMDRLQGELPIEVDDENRFLSWDEVRVLHSDGFELGAHTVNHPILLRVPPGEAEREVAASREMLEKQLGQPPRLFAYPNGDSSPGLAAMVGRYFEAAVTTRRGVCSRASQLLELPRVSAPARVEELSFELTRYLLTRRGEPLPGGGANLLQNRARGADPVGPGGGAPDRMLTSPWSPGGDT